MVGTAAPAASGGRSPFSKTAWAAIASLYDDIRSMPFNRELAAGQLSRERFQHYIVQDAHYLVVFAQALALAAAKADDPAMIRQFAESAATAVAVERELHERYFAEFGISAAIVAGTTASPTCHHYGAFLLATAFREPLPVVAAALLPCFWIYREVGMHVLHTALPDNLYQAWIDTYSGQEFSEAVDRMIGVCDDLARPASPDVEAAMHRVFVRASQLEWMFWDSAYRLEQWPVLA